MPEHCGWLFDMYADGKNGVALWLLGEDGRRYQFFQDFPVTFFVAGEQRALRTLWRYLRRQRVEMELFRTERLELFGGEYIPLLGVRVKHPADQPHLFRQVSTAFPHLTYYDADLPLSLRHAAVWGTFPLARCQLETDSQGHIRHLQVLDSPWDLEPLVPPLRTFILEPEGNPYRKLPKYLLVHTASEEKSRMVTYRLAFEPLRPLLVNLRALLQRLDPDLLLTTWGDTWLLPYLLAGARQSNIPLPLNRDLRRGIAYRPERSYFSYGQVIYRGRQVHLFGRWHIDRRNAMLWDDYQVEGILEVARLTSLPVQTAARVSPGSGVSAMQMLTALRQEVLIPWHKQQAESLKTALQMFAADQGGFVYPPLVGVHYDVAQIDFVSMYPGIMVQFNISPETVHTCTPRPADLLPLENTEGSQGRGLIPNTLAPLLNKRMALKNQLIHMPPQNPRRKAFQARASAHKWLLVTCFGYMGYKNARFGRIEAHEAVTAYGREILLRAKETAEGMGYVVLHMYVDGLWVYKEGAKESADFQALLEAIATRSGMPIALEGIYRWIAFLPSRLERRVPVPNRYFGVFKDGSLRVRGIEARRRDTPAFIREVQLQVLQLLAQDETRPEAAFSLVRRKLAELRGAGVPMEALVVSQKLSRSLEAYRNPSPAARAAAQLRAYGRQVRPGQRIEFIYVRGKPGVHAWERRDPPHPASVDVERYTTLLLRAIANVLQPFGIDEAALAHAVQGTPSAQLSLPKLNAHQRESLSHLARLHQVTAGGSVG